MAADKVKEGISGIPVKHLGDLKTSFTSEAKNLLAQNVCTKYDILDVCFDKPASHSDNHVYNCKVSSEVKPVTNQKSSGRCWIFAVLNAIRQQFCQAKKIDNFEFSQMNLYFWDKVERAYYLLNVYEEVARSEDCDDSRTMMFLMDNPSCDGGQWHMLVNLITKHGLMPKSAWPDSFSAQNSRRMNNIINSKMRSFAKQIVNLVKEKVSDDEMEKRKQKMLAEIYNVVSICLGTPPDKFNWEYYDTAKNYCKAENISPLDFYEQHVKPAFNVEDKICLVNDPRPKHSYNHLYTVKYLGNMVGQKIVYLNQPIEVLKYLSVASLKANEAVWFGCDVGKHFDRKQGLLSMNIHNYELTFHITMPALDKSDRLLFGESLMTHAMVLSGVSCDEPVAKEEQGDKQEEQKKDVSSQPSDTTTTTQDVSSKTTTAAAAIVSLRPVTTRKWRVENSWGDDKGDKGYLMMSDEWFSEFVYEVVVDRKFVPEEILKVLDQEPVVLPPWDPMGALACGNKCGMVL